MRDWSTRKKEERKRVGRIQKMKRKKEIQDARIPGERERVD